MITQNKTKLKLFIYPEITKVEFLLRIKNDPFCLYKDNFIQRALYVLYHCCLLHEKSESAKQILIQAGLKAFIPETAKKRKSKDLNMARIKSRKIYYDIEEYKDILGAFLKKRYTSETEKDKDEAIKNAYTFIFGTQPSACDFDFLTCGEHNKDRTAIAIGFFCLKYNVRYESVKKRYYDICKSDTEVIFKKEAPKILNDPKWLKYLIKNKIGPSQFLVSR